MTSIDNFSEQWKDLERKLNERFGKTPDLDAILFLIGIQETGFVEQRITKEQKQDLMHVAICTIMSADGYYHKERVDEEGWPHFTQEKDLPEMSLGDQENYLRQCIIRYFEKQGL